MRKHRRALLSDLSTFVKVTKALENALRANYGEEVEINVEELVLKAFKTVTRAVRFLDVWEDHMQSTGLPPNQDSVPPTPPADCITFGNQSKLASFSPRQSTAANNTDNANDPYDTKEHEQQTNVRPHYNRASQSLVRPGSRTSCSQPTRPLSRQGSAQVTHRVSCCIHPSSPNLASIKLGGLHNTFLSYLGYFIGLHIQSRSSSELLLTTKQCVVACRDFDDLIKEIWERDWRRSDALRLARDDMYRKIAELAEAARDIFHPLQSEEEELRVPMEGKPLMDAATACVRAAGECVAECRLIIDRIGDFDFPFEATAISPLETSASPASTIPLNAVNEDHVISSSDESPVYPASADRFPIPPSQQVLSTQPILPLQPVEQPSADTQPSQKESWPITSGELLPPLPPFAPSLLSQNDQCPSPQFSIGSNETPSINGRARKDSVDVSSAGDSGYMSSMRDSETSAVSQVSTRATSPDATLSSSNRNESFTSCGGIHRYGDRDADEMEADLLERTYAHELAFNKDGQITGGTLPALIERLTTPDSTPDATFVSTFFLTFRLFATPPEFAQALIDRFNYVGDSPRISGPVRLRVYNIFKGWLESHWRNDCDRSALDMISTFATRQLQIVLPTAGKRLVSLADQVITTTNPLVPRLLSSVGKTNTAIAQYIPPDTPMPAPALSKSQMNALKSWKLGSATIGILDFDPLELARQLTIKESQIFCSILPEELLASEWMKQSGSLAVNVRAMSRLSTDLTNLVTDNILQVDDPKKRAAIIKQWTKIAEKLLELANYHSLVAIVCSLTQSTIGRLKRTWEHVSNKTKLRLERLKSIVNHERNYASLRGTFQNQIPPCVPWVGLYLTDLTFVDAGNQTTRQLPGSGFGESKSVINFDKHMKTARIISELQRFQVPYRLTEVPELQTWLQDQLVRVRTVDQTTVAKDHYRRSLLLEPRAMPETQALPSKEKFDMKFFLGAKDKSHPITAAPMVV